MFCWCALLFLVLFQSNFSRYHSKNAPDFLTKMNNIVWSCCILHNLLLGVDGLDKLWTKEDYLSTWCALDTQSCVCTHFGCDHTLWDTGTQILMQKSIQHSMFKLQRTLLSSSSAPCLAVVYFVGQKLESFVQAMQFPFHRRKFLGMMTKR